MVAVDDSRLDFQIEKERERERLLSLCKFEAFREIDRTTLLFALDATDSCSDKFSSSYLNRTKKKTPRKFTSFSTQTHETVNPSVITVVN